MNVVHAGENYQIYGESLKVYSELPVRAYEVRFNKMTGFSLGAHPDLSLGEEKIYGNHKAKVKKSLDSFKRATRNFGIILSGKKGIGKTLFARLLAKEAQEAGYPLIIVPYYVPGIASFISSIHQEVIVLFDEFEKTFGSKDGEDPQEELLSLFDGIDSGKKMFVITCNETGRLNEFLINRPGRFHYHFTLGTPTAPEIREYLTDKLLPEYHSLIDSVIGFSMAIGTITFDILRAIAFELNQGYPLEETISDLNISKEGYKRYKVVVTLSDGTIATESFRINLAASHNETWWFRDKAGKCFNVSFNFSDIMLDYLTGRIVLPAESCSLSSDSDEDGKDCAGLEIVNISLTREKETSNKYC